MEGGEGREGTKRRQGRELRGRGKRKREGRYKEREGKKKQNLRSYMGGNVRRKGRQGR